MNRRMTKEDIAQEKRDDEARQLLKQLSMYRMWRFTLDESVFLHRIMLESGYKKLEDDIKRLKEILAKVSSLTP